MRRLGANGVYIDLRRGIGDHQIPPSKLRMISFETPIFERQASIAF